MSSATQWRRAWWPAGKATSIPSSRRTSKAHARRHTIPRTGLRPDPCSGLRRRASAERSIDPGWRLGEELGPALSHVPAVLDPNAELARNIEPRLVGKA